MKKRGIAGILAGAGGALYLLAASRRGRERPPKPGGLGAPPHIPWWVLIPPAVFAFAAFGGLVYLMFVNPHMLTQNKATAYRAIVPLLPPQIVPTEAVAAPAIPPQQNNPLSDTPQTRQIGQIYYGYYCLFCHGADGRGDGPVGLSYVPTPADLTAPPVRNLSDAALYRAMLAGVGHHPVLPYVILPEAPWYIVIYVRHLPEQSQQQ
jgi:hypothetical protein